MTVLTPASTFDDVYQLETTDPVTGGPGGVANRQAQALLNRTLYLKNALAAALPLADGSTAVTQPQFDSDNSVATTAFVQRAMGNVQGFVAYTASQVLTAAQSGFLIGFASTTAAATFTLPTPVGQAGKLKYMFTNYSAYSLTLTTPAGVFTHGNGLSSIVVLSGSCVSIVADGSNWQLTDGDTYLQYSPLFGSVKALNGYQKIPGGLIFQWGSAVFSAAGSSISYPIAFPNACLSIMATDNDTGRLSIFGISGVTTTSFIGFTNQTTEGAGWLAIGW